MIWGAVAALWVCGAAIPAAAQVSQGTILSFSTDAFLNAEWVPLSVRIENTGSASWFTVKFTSLPSGWQAKADQGGSTTEVRLWLERGEKENFKFQVKSSDLVVNGEIGWELWGTWYGYPNLVEQKTQTVRTVFRPAPFTLLSPAQGEEDVAILPTFQWQHVTYADSYRVELFHDDNGLAETTPFFQSPPIQNTSLVYDGSVPLEFQQAYWWQVIAQNPYAETLNTEGTLQFVTEVSQLGNFYITSPTSGVRYDNVPPITWGTSYQADYYSVQIYEDVAGQPASSPIYSKYNLTGNSHTLPAGTLTKGRSYWVRVRAWRDGFSQPADAVNSPLTFTYSSLQPFAMWAPAQTSGSVSVIPRFRWYRSVGATGYRVEIYGFDDGNEGFVFFDTVGAMPEPEYTFTKGALMRNQWYAWTVYALGMGEEVQSSTGYWLFQTSNLPPFHLYSPAYGEVGVPIRPKFFWEPIPFGNVFGNQIEVWTDSDGTLKLVHARELPASSTSHEMDNPLALHEGQTYYWRVLAKTSADSGRYNEGGLHPFVVTQLGNFQQLEPTDLNYNVSVNPRFTWEPSANAQSYSLAVWLATPSTFERIGNPVVVVNDIPTTEYVFENPPYLTGKTEYVWRAYAVKDGHFLESWSGDFRFRTVNKVYLFGEGVKEALLGQGRLTGEAGDFADINLDGVIDIADLLLWNKENANP